MSTNCLITEIEWIFHLFLIIEAGIILLSFIMARLLIKCLAIDANKAISFSVAAALIILFALFIGIPFSAVFLLPSSLR